MAFLFVLIADGGFKRLFVLGAPCLAFAFEAVAPDGGEYAGGLFASHDRDARIGPDEKQAGIEGAAAHAVITGAERAAVQYGEFGDAGGRDRRPPFGALARAALVFVFAHSV